MGKTKVILFLILVSGLFLRLINLNQGLWLDEAIGAVSVKQFSGGEIIRELSTRDNHPPLYYLMLDQFTEIFGYSDTAIRMLGVILGVFAIYLTYKLSHAVGVYSPMIPSFLMSISPFMVYYSQEARMYMLTVVVALIVAIYLVKVIDHDRTFDWLALSVSLVLLFLSDYILLFMLPVVLLSLVVTKASYKRCAKIALSFTPMFVVAALWLPTLMIQVGGYAWLSRNFTQWFEIVGGISFKEAFLLWSKMLLGRVSINPDWVYLVFVLFFSLPVLILLFRSFHRIKKTQWVVFAIFVFPPLISLLSSLFIPTFNYFRFTYTYPFLAIVVAIGVGSRNILKSPLAILWIFGMTVGLLLTHFDPLQGREAWREASQMINQNKVMLYENSVVLHEFPEPFAPWRWYNSQVPSFGATDALSATSATYSKVREIVEDFDTVYYFEYLSEVTNPNDYTKKALIDSGYIETKAFSNFNGIGIIRLWQR